MPDKKHIRNSTAEFLIFSAQSGGDGLEVRYEEETIWLSQKLMARLFEVDVRTVSEHLGNIYESGGGFKRLAQSAGLARGRRL